MVPHESSGRSFKGLFAYLTSGDRIEWTHSFNLIGDDPHRACRQMQALWYARDQIKAVSGAQTTGRAAEIPVWHLSLSFPPDQQLTQAEMIAAAQFHLHGMGMEDNQAFLIAHNDTAHAHVHIVVNRVNPANGLMADIHDSQKRLSDLALEYEQQQGKIYCEQRLDAAEKRKAQRRRKEQGQTQALSQSYSDHTLTVAYAASDNGQQFKDRIESKGWALALGDKKDVLMVVTPNGKAFNVLRDLNKSRAKGDKLKAADLGRKLGDLDLSGLQKVAAVQAALKKSKAAGKGQKQAKTPGKIKAKVDFNHTAAPKPKAHEQDNSKAQQARAKLKAAGNRKLAAQQNRHLKQKNGLDAGLFAKRQQTNAEIARRYEFAAVELTRRIEGQRQMIADKRVRFGGLFYRLYRQEKDREALKQLQQALARQQENERRERRALEQTQQKQRDDLAQQQAREKAALAQEIANDLARYDAAQPDRQRQTAPRFNEKAANRNAPEHTPQQGKGTDDGYEMER